MLADSRLAARPLDFEPGSQQAAQRVLPLSDEVRILDSDLRAPRGNANQPAASSAAAARGRGAKNPGETAARPQHDEPLTDQAGRAKSPAGSHQPGESEHGPRHGAAVRGNPARGPLGRAQLVSDPARLQKSPRSSKTRKPCRAGRGMDVEAVRAMLASPKRLREVAILSEVLKPPPGLRPRGRLR